MKRFLTIIGLTILFSCETERILFNGPYHVRFTEGALTEKESNSSTIKIEIHNAGPAAAEELIVSYDISGDAREDVDYQIVGTRGAVTIPANEFFGYIEVKLINNSNNILRSQDVIFKLTRVDSKSLEVGQGEGGIGKTFTLTIEDDCILGGPYTGYRGTSSSKTPGIKITSFDCENYLISNWDIGVFGAADPMPLEFFDHGDNTLTIPNQEVTANYGFYSVDYTVEGVGSVNPTTKEIFLSLTFSDDTDTYNVTLTFKPE